MRTDTEFTSETQQFLESLPRLCPIVIYGDGPTRSLSIITLWQRVHLSHHRPRMQAAVGGLCGRKADRAGQWLAE